MKVGARAWILFALGASLAGCSHAPVLSDTKQCGEFCRQLDACLGSEFSDESKAQLCELARCESGCRARVRSAAGYVGAFQFDVRTWKGDCGPIFERRDLGHCRKPDARNDLCCAAVCTAELIAQGELHRWPNCGK